MGHNNRFLIFLSIFLLCTASAVAQTKQTLRLPGLQAPVEVLRDEWGVNHIYAKNEHDLFFAQGYCAAQDRLFQFEIWRRQATGTVAEILGPQEINRDIGTRLFKFRGDTKKELNHYHPNGTQIINAYVDGVNAYVEKALKAPDLLPIEFALLNIKPGKWTPEIVISRHQGLLGNIVEELNVGRAVAKAGQSIVKELVWFHPKDPDLNLDSSITERMLSKNILELYNAYRKPVSFKKEDLASATIENNSLLEEQAPQGSNNWIIAGRKTSSGAPFLANDPHRSIALPSLRYLVHLVAPGWNVTGAGEPVIPGVSIGHNEHGAWGLTIFETDGEDLYVYDINPENLAQYKYKGKWVNMEEMRESIRVKGSQNFTATLRYTLHGPVTYIDSTNFKAYAVKCAWLQPGGAPYLASLRINQAKTWADFRAASKYSHIPGENMIWADKRGNIGWQVVGIAPIRNNFSGMVPVPGDGRYEWDGYLDILKRPHALNPEKGFFATANQHVTPEHYEHWNTIGYTWADPFRGERINEVLHNDNQITLDETKALQTDYFSIPARMLVPMLQRLSFDADLTKRAKGQLLNWNYVLDRNSVAAGIYAMWERKLYAAANDRFVPAPLKGLVRIQLKKIIDWLNMPDKKFGIDSIHGRDGFLAETFEQAVKELASKLGYDVTNWRYGQNGYKHSTITHSLNDILPVALKEKFIVGPLPRGGNSHTPNSTGSGDNQSSGASFRMIADVADWDKTLMINTPGQSADTRSKWHNNLFSLWAGDGYFPAYFTKEKIRSVTKEQTMLLPAK